MNFTELTKEEFESFLKKHPLQTFFQDPKMDEIRKLDNWNSYYVGVKENNKVIAATRMVSKTRRFNKKIFYAPRGILIDYKNKELLEFFIKNIKKYIKQHNGYTFHIDPPLIYKERDINGDIVENGIDNSIVVNTLKELGFHHEGFIRHYDYTKLNNWIFELPIEGKTEQDLLKEMNGNTRRAIKKAEHLQVKVRELNKDELSLFKDIMDHTSERKEFIDKNLDYYNKMYDLFHPTNEVKYVIAEVNLNDTLKVLDTDLNDLLKTKERAESHNKLSLLKETDSQIKDLEARIAEIKNIKNDKGDILYLSSAMFMIYGDEIMYYHSGGYKEYMSFFGQYLIQWEMIKEALKLNKKVYNFYGIKGSFDKSDPEYGVYLFKKGFNGHVTEYIGDFYLPISIFYYIQQIGKKVKNGIRRIKN